MEVVTNIKIKKRNDQIVETRSGYISLFQLLLHRIKVEESNFTENFTAIDDILVGLFLL